METIKLKLAKDLQQALKDRDIVATKTIRSLIAAIDNAQAVVVDAPKIMPMAGGIAGATDGLGSSEVDRKELSDEDIKTIIRNEMDEIDKTIELIKTHARPEVEELTVQMNLLSKYLQQF